MGSAKWIGGFLGLLGGGPLGALAGFALGTLYDKLSDSAAQAFSQTNSGGHQQPSGTSNEEGARNGFFFALMVLSAHVIAADDKIMHSEMECMRRFIRQNFGEQAVAQCDQIIKRLFEKRKQIGADAWNREITACCNQIAGVMPEEQRLLLLRYLVEIAKADGNIAPEEVQCLYEIAVGLRLSTDEVDQLRGMGKSTLDDAYKVLGLTADATDDEVRKAYRKMALKHHPDKVANLGEDVRKEAEKKFKDIAAAKDLIYQSRGMN